MAITAYLGLIMTLALPGAPTVSQEVVAVGGLSRPATPSELPTCAKPYEEQTETYEEQIKRSPKDANLCFKLGICLYWQVRSANEMAIAANNALIVFVTECNKDLSCEDGPNRAIIALLQSRQDALTLVFNALRDRAIEAFAASVAIGGPETQTARNELEKLYKTKSSPFADNPPLAGLDDLIARKKRELSK